MLAFPYDAHIVALVRDDPAPALRLGHARVVGAGRRLGGRARRRGARALSRADRRASEVDAWLAGIERRWVGHVRTTRHDGRGWWVLETRAGTVPEALRAGAVERDGALLVPLTETAGAASCAGSARRAWTPPPSAAWRSSSSATTPPPARLVVARGVDGERLRLEVAVGSGDRDRRSSALPGAAGEPRGAARPVARRAARRVHRAARRRRSTARRVERARRAARRAARRRPPRSARSRARPRRADRRRGRRARRRARAVSVGRRALRARGAARLPRRRAGARQDRRGARGARGRRRLPGDRRLPGVDEARLAARGRGAGCRTARWRSIEGRVGGAADAARSRSSTTRSSPPTARRSRGCRPRALVVDESHYCKNPQAKRTQRGAPARRRASPRTGCASR